MSDADPGWVRHTLPSGGINLAVFAAGTDSIPAATSPDHDPRAVVIFVHGWPDTHTVWNPVAARLRDEFRVFAYDTRGLGDSDRPREVSAYRIRTLADDLYAVTQAVSPGVPVHVVAHDWGSIQSWEAVSRGDASDHIASFTTISGPSLDHASAWLRHNFTHPTPRNLRSTLVQLISSTYIVLFHLPVLPWLFLTILGSPKIWRGFLRIMDGTPGDQVITAPTLRRDMISGIRYYRANIVPKLRHPDLRTTDVPVLQLINTRDFAVRPQSVSATNHYVSKLWRRESATGHWLPTTHPAYVAENIRDFVNQIATDGESSSTTGARDAFTC
ncbi:MAG: alpha/beta fold hydrolase [Gordonia sp. (in: high G+C Gram-positive bacteria)]